jgi:hypothetical protein
MSLGNSFGIAKFGLLPVTKSVSRNENNLLKYISDLVKMEIELPKGCIVEVFVKVMISFYPQLTLVNKYK